MSGNARPGLDKRKRRPRIGWAETPAPGSYKRKRPRYPLILNLLKDGRRVFCYLTITPPVPHRHSRVSGNPDGTAV